jgi:2,5-diketo-D-gluconate reductase A
VGSAPASPARQHRDPKSVTPTRVRQSFNVFGFVLSPAGMEAISGLDRAMRTGPDPDTMS